MHSNILAVGLMISNIQGSESHSSLPLLGIIQGTRIGTEDQAFIYSDKKKTCPSFLLLFHGMIGKLAISSKVKY
jgi:hypothetical protein